jgi:hypothetical protein
MATRLHQLEIEEVSGVASPANELPGFLVAKSAQLGRPLTADEIVKEADRMESDYAILYSALQACAQYMTDAPPEVQTAVETLNNYIEGLFSNDGQDDGSGDATDPGAAGSAGAGGTTPVQQSADGKSLIARMLGRSSSEKATKSTETKQEPTEKSKPAPAETKTEPAEKSADGTDPVIKGLGEALVAVADVLKGVSEKVDSLVETQGVHSQVLNATLDRLGAVEANRYGGDDFAPISQPTQKSAEKGEDALRAAIVAVAQRPGTSVTLGRGT